MYKTKIFKIIVTAALAIGVLVSGFTASAASIIMVPTAQNVPDGNVFSVDIIAGGLPADSTGGSIDISWAGDAVLDSIYLATTDPADSNGGKYVGNWDPVSTFFSGPGAVDNGASTVTGLYVGSFFGVQDTQSIARLNFTLGTGTVTMSMMDAAFGGQWGATDENGPYFFSNTYTGTTINPVPVPAALWLFGSGLIGLAGVARRRI